MNNSLINYSLVALTVGLLSLVSSEIFAQSAPVILPTAAELTQKSNERDFEFIYNINRGTINILNNAIPSLSVHNMYPFAISVRIEDEIHQLQASAAFRFKADTRNSIPSFVWRSSDLIIHALFFEISKNTFQISIVVYNVSKRALHVGVRLLFDTEFITKDSGALYSARREFSTEQAIIPEADEQYVALRQTSPPTESEQVRSELVFVIKGNNISQPSKIILANQQRLERLPWYFRIIENRALHYPPYQAVNEALAFYFDQIAIAPDSKIVHQMVLGNDSQNIVHALPYGVALLQSGNFDVSGLLKILSSVEDALEYIGLLFEEDTSVTDDDIDVLSDQYLRVESELENY